MCIVEACKQCLFSNSNMDVKQITEIIISAYETYILNVRVLLSYSGYSFFSHTHSPPPYLLQECPLTKELFHFAVMMRR